MLKPILLGVLILISACFSSQAQNAEVEDKLISIHMNQKPLYTVLTRLINKYDIAIGFEESFLDREHRHYYFETNVPPDNLKAIYSSEREFLGSGERFSEDLISLDFSDSRLADVLDSIVKQMKNYSWEINDNVVNIFPVRGRDSRLKHLLDTRVSRFALGRGDSVGEIQSELMLFLPEFKKFLADSALEADATRPGTTFTDRILSDGMSFSNLPFKELLNAITKSKRGGWILQIKERKDKPGKEYVELLI
jgi:hypothetical protein